MPHVDCDDCAGTGECAACAGTGKVKQHSDDEMRLFEDERKRQERLEEGKR